MAGARIHQLGNSADVSPGPCYRRRPQTMEREASSDLLDLFWELAQDGDVYAEDLLAFDGDTDHNPFAVQDSLGGPCIGADTSGTPLAAAFSPLDRQPSTVSTSPAACPELAG